MSTSKLDKVFKLKKHRILNMYCTAGFPQLESTIPVMKSLQYAGADIIELGIPYSDPIADGPVIQESNATAIANGISIHKIFDQLSDLKNEITVPVILMGYLNPVLQFGFEKFCAEAERLGVSGIILPDLPMQEYDDHYVKTFKKYNLQFIFLITPATSPDRIKQFDKRTGGFLYAVSAAGTTGEKASSAHKVGNYQQSSFETNSLENTRESDENKEQVAYFKRLQTMKLRHPILIGFGISDKKSFDNACKFAAGAIIGSAYIKALKNEGEIEAITREFVERIIL